MEQWRRSQRRQSASPGVRCLISVHSGGQLAKYSFFTLGWDGGNCQHPSQLRCCPLSPGTGREKVHSSSPLGECLGTERQPEQLPMRSSEVIWTQELRGWLIGLCPWGPLKNHHMNYSTRSEGKVWRQHLSCRKESISSGWKSLGSTKTPSLANETLEPVSLAEQQSCSSLDHHNVATTKDWKSKRYFAS